MTTRICSECDNDTFEEEEDGFVYCQECGVRTEDIIQTVDDDDDQDYVGVDASTVTRFWSLPVDRVYRRPPRASRSWTVEMLPRVTIVEKGTCVICLEKWRKGDMATELPCKHKYHFECMKKWLEIHATCPQCRFEIPLESEEH